MPGDSSRTGSLNISSDPDEIAPLLDELEKILEMSRLDEMSAFHLRCAVVEVVNNCVQHAYKNKAGQPIKVKYHIDVDHVRIGVSDRGPAFSGPHGSDETSPMDKCGRGYEIINSWVSSLHFERKCSWNTCWLVKKVQKV